MENQQEFQGKERPRTGTSPEILAQAILDNLYYLRGCPPELATRNDWYMALAYTVRDRLLANWVQTLRWIRFSWTRD
jgi:glycogen phosphorylase